MLDLRCETMPVAPPPSGVYPNVPDEDYFKIAAVSASLIKAMAISPAHAKQRMMAETPVTDAMAFGSQYHRMLFQPDLFGSTVVSVPKFERRSAADKERWAKLVSDYGERNICWESEYQQMTEMRKKLLRHRVAGPIIRKSAEPELVIVWTDPGTGLPCKAKVDATYDKRMIAVDLKTTQSAQRFDFGREAVDRGYHLQAGWYDRGLRMLEKKEPSFLFIAQEKAAPYEVGVYHFSGRAADAAAILIDRHLVKIRECVLANEWEGYTPLQSEPLFVPDYVFKDASMEIQE